MERFDKAKEKVQELLDKTELDEMIAAGAKTVRDKAQQILDRTEIDEKIAAGARDLTDRAGAILGGITGAAGHDEPAEKEEKP